MKKVGSVGLNLFYSGFSLIEGVDLDPVVQMLYLATLSVRFSPVRLDSTGESVGSGTEENLAIADF